MLLNMKKQMVSETEKAQKESTEYITNEVIKIVESKVSQCLQEYLQQVEHRISFILNGIQETVGKLKPESPLPPIKGDPGEPGRPGKDVDVDALVNSILSKVKTPPKPKDGRTPSKAELMKISEEAITGYFIKNPIKTGIDETVVKNLLSQHKPSLSAEDIASLADRIARTLEKAPVEKKLDYETGLKNKPGRPVFDTKKRSLTRGGGESSSAVLPVLSSGSINGVNQDFVFTTAPAVLVVDGIPRQKTQSDGTENWTGTTSITLAVAPNFDLFALA